MYKVAVVVLPKVPNILMPAVSWGEKEIWYQVGE